MTSQTLSKIMGLLTGRSLEETSTTLAKSSVPKTSPSLPTLSSETKSNQLKETKMTEQLFELNFNDRLSYLAWRDEWKKVYFAKIAEIRAAKVAFKNKQREIEFVVKQYAWGPEVLAKLPEGFYNAMSEPWSRVKELDKLVELRENSRIKSAEQRQTMLKERGLV